MLPHGAEGAASRHEVPASDHGERLFAGGEPRGCAGAGQPRAGCCSCPCGPPASNPTRCIAATLRAYSILVQGRTWGRRSAPRRRAAPLPLKGTRRRRAAWVSRCLCACAWGGWPAELRFDGRGCGGGRGSRRHQARRGAAVPARLPCSTPCRLACRLCCPCSRACPLAASRRPYAYTCQLLCCPPFQLAHCCSHGCRGGAADGGPGADVCRRHRGPR